MINPTDNYFNNKSVNLASEVCSMQTWFMLTCSTTFFCFSLSSTASWIIFCSFLSSKVRALVCSLHSSSSSFSFVNSILRFFFSLLLSSKTEKQKVLSQIQLFYISYSDLFSLNGFTEIVNNKPGGQRATNPWKNEPFSQ